MQTDTVVTSKTVEQWQQSRMEMRSMTKAKIVHQHSSSACDIFCSEFVCLRPPSCLNRLSLIRLQAQTFPSWNAFRYSCVIIEQRAHLDIHGKTFYHEILHRDELVWDKHRIVLIPIYLNSKLIFSKNITVTGKSVGKLVLCKCKLGKHDAAILAWCISCLNIAVELKEIDKVVLARLWPSVSHG